MMMQATRTIPIVFVQVIDPVGSGFVKRLARPGGNVTGFTPFEYSLAGKWVELLRQITPDVSEMESEIAAFAGSPNGGLVVTVGGTATHRDLIIALAAKHRLPAVYPYSYFVSAGGLISYRPDTIDQYRRAAGYIDR